MMSGEKETILANAGILPMRAKDICDLLGGCSLYGVDPETSFHAIAVSDNMAITKGCLFIPYQESDEFLARTIKNGAAAVMTDHLLEDIPFILVDDLTRATCRLCEIFGAAVDLPSVAVCGSEGKTTTKRMVKSVLRQSMSVFSQDGNYNTLQALCCSLQQVPPGTEVIVQEVDEKRLRNTANCSRILKPKIALVTNVAEAHIAFYGGKEGLKESFRGIVAGMPEDGIIILNGDDPDSMDTGFGAKIMTVGIHRKDVDCRASGLIENRHGAEFDLTCQNETCHVKLSTHGEHNVYNAMMAFLTGKLFGLGTPSILRGLAEYRDSGIRQNCVRIGRTLVYADCFNASATSVEYAIKCFCGMTERRGKRVAVLGDIAEIEGYEEETYRRIASFVDAAPIDILITCGKDSERILEYTSSDLVKIHAGNTAELNRALERSKRNGGRNYLFKASRFMKLEESIKAEFPLHYKIMLRQDKLFRT